MLLYYRGKIGVKTMTRKDYNLYSRYLFKKWLEKLDQDKTFCGVNHCPISQFLSDRFGHDIGVINAADLATKLAAEIDGYDYPDQDGSWHLVTPRFVLKCINNLGVC